MANTVKMCDMSADIAVKVFQMLNPGKVNVKMKAPDIGGIATLATTVEPKQLVYPEGWYYVKGRFTNKHNSTSGVYASVIMYNANNDQVWDLPYCTVD